MFELNKDSVLSITKRIVVKVYQEALYDIVLDILQQIPLNLKLEGRRSNIVKGVFPYKF